jgi:hypothetical protein
LPVLPVIHLAVHLHLLNGKPIRKSPTGGFRRLDELTWRIGEAERQLYRVSPTYESSGLEPSLFERDDAEAANSVARRLMGFTGVIVDDITAAHQ